MPMLPKETPTPIPIFRPVLSFVAPGAIGVVVGCEEDEEAEGILEVGRLVGNEFDRVVLVIKSLL
jgi:hypothetical protein